MGSAIVKCVAGAGKTTQSINYLRKHPGGLYLAYNVSVAERVTKKGQLGRTIDAFFQSYIIPKFSSTIPIIANGAKIEYLDSNELIGWKKGLSSYSITDDGMIMNKSSNTGFSLDTQNADLQKSNEKNSRLLKSIFTDNALYLTDGLRAEISNYLLVNYPQEIIDIVNGRFKYVIIDEAQDLGGYKETFAKLLFESKNQVIVYGDENQNINSGGAWFENAKPNRSITKSYRCPESNCKWIRDNLGIEIYGNDTSANFEIINIEDALQYDDGNRTLLYFARSGKQIVSISKNWKGPQINIKKAKGDTIEGDIVIVGASLNTKAYYTAITRATGSVFSTIQI